MAMAEMNLGDFTLRRPDPADNYLSTKKVIIKNVVIPDDYLTDDYLLPEGH